MQESNGKHFIEIGNSLFQTSSKYESMNFEEIKNIINKIQEWNHYAFLCIKNDTKEFNNLWEKFDAEWNK